MSADASWWVTGAGNTVNTLQCQPSSALGCTFDEIVDAISDAYILGGILLETGSGTPNAIGYVDLLTITIGGTTYSYNFEP